MVHGVCARVLHSAADADDAAQACFLVLAKKAKGGRWQNSIANWLYTTARKVAHNAKAGAARRVKREGPPPSRGGARRDAMSGGSWSPHSTKSLTSSPRGTASRWCCVPGRVDP